MDLEDAYTVASYANNMAFSTIGEIIDMKNNKGPNAGPCGTPQLHHLP